MESSKIHLTQTGQKCKKCLAKGGPCHLHGGKTPAKKTPKKTPTRTPKRVSPKKSPKKSSPKKSPTVAWTDQLPAPALYEMLLGVKPESLNAVCRASKNAAKICAEKRFQEQYSKKHNFDFESLIKGNLHIISSGEVMGADLFGDETYFLKDEKGNEVFVNYDSSSNRIEKITYRAIEQKKTVDIVLKRYGNKWEMEFETLNGRRPPQKDLTDLLQLIGKNHWYRGWDGRFKNKNREKEVIDSFIKSVKPKISKVLKQKW